MRSQNNPDVSRSLLIVIAVDCLDAGLARPDLAFMLGVNPNARLLNRAPIERDQARSIVCQGEPVFICT
jgi:hypothetical protein